MSEDKDTGRPESAFPSTFKSVDPGTVQIHRWGMTLRDYFAAKAMQAMLLNQPPHDTDEPYSAYASDAYEIADAMLKARKQ